MKGETTAKDEILDAPPEGKGESLKILYKLPRPAMVAESVAPDQAQPKESAQPETVSPSEMPASVDAPTRSGMSTKSKLFIAAGVIGGILWLTK